MNYTALFTSETGYYDRLGIDKSPKATDLNEFFEIHSVKIPTANGRKNGFEIRGIL